MKQLTKRLAAALLSVTLLVSGTGCAWTQPEDTTPSEPQQTEEVTLPAGSNCYTYRDRVDTMPVNWNPQEWGTQAEADLLALMNPGLYAISPANNEHGYVLSPEMAASAPVDVTGQYAGNDTYNIPDDAETGYAYRIDLNPKATWDDGTVINADTYLYSLKQMLSSEAKHSRASMFWSGLLRIANARDYYMQDMVGQATYLTLADAGYASVAEARNDGVSTLYLDMDGFWGLDCGWKSLEDGTLIRDEAVPEGEDEDMVSANYLYQNYLADGNSYSAYQTTFIGIRQSRVIETAFEDVGILKTGDYQITLILDRPLTAETLQWALTTGWLVKEDRYSSDYCTSVETSPSCGPYKLTVLEDGFCRLEENETWYGHSDDSRRREYQATAVEYTLYASKEAAWDAFEQDLLDTVTISAPGAESMTEHSTYVTKLTFNSSLTALNLRESDGVDKSILSHQAFRRGISLALDRQAFVESCVPGSETALGLLGSSFLSDLSTGEAYRDSAAGRQVMEKLYGSADSTGYDSETAGNLFQQAYDDALAAGRMDETDTVELELLVYNDDPVYDRMVSFLQDAVTVAAVGTSLENRIRILKTVNPDYYTAARDGQFDMILSTWGGAPWDPYSIMDCYCNEDRKFEFGFEPSVESCTIQLNDSNITRTYRGWYEALINGKYAAADPETRNQLLSGLEHALLSNYHTVPLYQRSTHFLDSGRIARVLAEPLPLIGYGGVRFAQFTLDDWEWSEETGISIS